MVIYADILMAINFAVDYNLIKAASLYCGKRLENRRLVLAAAVGAISSLVIFLDMSGKASLFYRIVSAVMMSAAAFYPCSIRMLVKAGFAIFVQSFIVSGAVMLWQMTVEDDGMLSFAGSVYFDIGIPALIICAVIGYAAACVLSRILSQRLSPEQFCDIAVMGNGASVTFTALIDTGNSLIEPFSGYPVIVCELSALGGAVPEEVACFNFEDPISSKIRLVPYRTMDSAGLLPSFFPDKVLVHNRRVQNCCIAVTTARLGERYRAICNPNVLNNIVGDEAYEING